MFLKPKAIIFIMGAGLLVLHLVWFTAIVVRLPDSRDKIVFLEPADPEDLFSLDYRHSVEKTRVRGIFKVTKNRAMAAVETRMTSVGTGLPNTFPKRTTRQGQWMVVDEQDRPMASFRFFIQPVNKSVLTTPKGLFDLMILPPGTIVKIGVEKVSLFEALIHKSHKVLTSMQLTTQSKG